jgi:hypothetical protein
MKTPKHADMAMDKKAVKVAVGKHEANMHPGKPKTKLAKGGMVARGGGAATKGLKFTRNG